MKPFRVAPFILVAASILIFQIAWTNPTGLNPSASGIELSVRNQAVPTEIPLTEIDEEVLVTNPALLQVIILLGIVAVMVIFIGVWINRLKVNSR